MFVREKSSNHVFSASPLEDVVALIPIDGFVHPHVSETKFVSVDEFCEKYLRVNPVEVRDEYRKLKAAA